MKTHDAAASHLRNILSVSPFASDHAELQQVLQCGEHSRENWTVIPRQSLDSALQVIVRHPIAVVVCTADSEATPWREIFDRVARLRKAPALVVTARLADEVLWAEVLNLGAYDLLAKPFDDREVWRVLDSAWLHWCHRQNSRAAVSGSGGPSL